MHSPRNVHLMIDGLRIFVPACLLFLVISSAAQNESKAQCSSYQRCNDLGTKALQAGKTDAAIQLFELQAGYAEIADIEQGHADYGPGKTPSYTLGINAYNNLAVAYMHKGDYLRARLWCRVTLYWDKGNKAALFNLGRIEEKLKQWKWPGSVAGMYLRYAGRGQWESLCVKQNGSSKISVSFFGMRMGKEPEGTPASYGDFKANLELLNNSATYPGEPDFPCTVRMDFSEDKVLLKQIGDCGFGYGVEASGTFERASTSAGCPR